MYRLNTSHGSIEKPTGKNYYYNQMLVWAPFKLSFGIGSMLGSSVLKSELKL